MNILVLASSSWKSFGPLNCHFIAKHLAKSHRVVFVESIGLRWPRLCKHDFYKITGRIKKALNIDIKVIDNHPHDIDVVSVLCLPLGHSRLVNKLNLWFADWQLRKKLKKREFEIDLVWGFLPYMSELCKNVDAIKIYHKVDFYEANPGVAENLLIEMEDKALAAAEVAIGTSKPIVRQLVKRKERVLSWSNVGENYSHQSNKEMPKDLQEAAKERKIVGYIGNIAAHKIDLHWLCEVIDKCDEHCFVFIGQINEGGDRFSKNDWQRFINLKNVVFLGPKPYEEIKAYIDYFNVGLIPFRLSPLTHGSLPLKTFDFFSARVPVVSTRLDSYVEEEFEAGVFLVDCAEEGAETIKKLCQQVMDGNLIQKISEQYSWEQRFKDIDQLIVELSSNQRERQYEHRERIVSAS
ncbi:glycosyltransferase [Planctomycetota bacterium]|nr:glycosyltransferase [Planctomycetota bacterium]